MSTIWIREFVGGLDTRRMPVTTTGGALIRAKDGHINRGGEFEKRAAFVQEYVLPADETIGMAAGKSGIYVFGHGEPPDIPAGISYQRLQHPDGVTALTGVPSYDLHGGKIYAVGEFADGGRYHFYDGVRIPDWYDGRSRASFQVVAGGDVAAVSASGSFEITAGTLSAGVNKINSITIDGVAITNGSAIDHTGNNSTTASAIASAINSHTSTPDYSASATGQTVTITAVTAGTAANGKTIVVTTAGDAVSANVQNMAGGSAATSATLDDLTVNGVSILGSVVTWTTSNSATAELIAAAINTEVSAPDYTATAVEDTVNIVAADTGEAPNGRVVAFTTGGGFTVSPDTGLVMAGGSDPVDATSATGSFAVTAGTAGAANKVTDIQVNGVSIIDTEVLWTTSHTATATAIANEINGFVSSPNYTATSDGATVTVTASSTGPAVNGKSISVTVGGDVTVGSGQAMSGGADAEAVFVPGTFVKTIGSRMHSVSGANEHFSGINAPTRFTTDVTGAGFIDMSTQASGSETLTGLGKYQQLVAVFAERVIQIWYFDADPELNDQRQVLSNTGTASPRSITQFGDNDIFYTDESGVRSLRARDASNAAATTDIGVPIDTLVIEKLRGLTAEEREKVIGVVEPSDGRVWISMLDEIFVFSFFGGSKISAWSTYTPTAEVDGETIALEIDNMVAFRRKVYVRSGDAIYVYGGLETAVTYDSTQAEAWLPYLDGESPTKKKTLNAIDAALEGQWAARVAMNLEDETVSDEIGVLTKTTYNDEAIPAAGESTHFSLRFTSQGSGPAKLSSAVIHYTVSADED